jgi:hypothetical protein
LFLVGLPRISPCRNSAATQILNALRQDSEDSAQPCGSGQLGRLRGLDM